MTDPSQSVTLTLPRNVAIEYAIYLVFACSHTHRRFIEIFSPRLDEVERWNGAEAPAVAKMADLAASRE